MLQNQTGIVVGSFSQVEVQQMAAKRNVQWVWSDATFALGLVEMTSVDNVLSDLYQKQNGLVGFASTFSQ